MKTWVIIKNTLLTIFSICAIIYCTILFAVPYLLNKKDYSKTITDLIKKETGLVLLIQDYKISVQPNLNVGLKAKGLQLFYPNKHQIADIKNSHIDISLFTLFKKEIKLTTLKADEFQFSTKLQKNGKTTFTEYLQKNITKQDNNFKISQTIPIIKVKKYTIKLKDEASGQKYKLVGKEFELTQNSDIRYVNLKTQGSAYCFEHKYIDYNTKFIIPKVLFTEVNNNLLDINFENIFKQKFYAKIASDLKINTQNNKFSYLTGKIDIDNFIVRIGQNTLPPSHFHITTDKGTAHLISKFYTDKNEVSDINAKIKLTKPYNINLNCNCPNANIENLQKILIPILDILKIKSPIKDFTATGKINATFSVKTDFKTIKSSGNLKITNGTLTHKKTPLTVTKANAIIDFNNDNVKIKQSTMLANNQPIAIWGDIDANTTCKLFAKAENLDLNNITKSFSIIKKELKENVKINSGKLSFIAEMTGKLEELKPTIKSTINNLTIEDKKLKTNIKTDLVQIDVNANASILNGKIILSNTNIKAKNIPNSTKSLHSDITTIKFDENNINITPSKFTTGNANLTIFGEIKNYKNKPSTSIVTQGSIDTDLIKSFVPKTLKLENKGYLPTKATFIAKDDIIITNIKLLSNSENYITPIHINNFKTTNTLTNIQLISNEESLLINDATVYYANGINNLIKEVNLQKLKKVINLKGKITNLKSKPLFENIHFQTLETLSIKLPNLKYASINANADIIINGKLDKPNFSGIVQATNLNIPDYYIKAPTIVITLAKNLITAKIDNLKIKDILLSATTTIPTDIVSTKKINNLKIDANYIDLDYLLALQGHMIQAKYAPGTEFPYTLQNGSLNIKNFKTGNITAQDITANIATKNNTLTISNLFATAYNGKIAGLINYNFPYTSIDATIQGRGLNAATAASALMPKEQQLSGKLNFDAKLNLYGTRLDQQIKTLNGEADVLVQNGHLGQLGRFEHFLYAQNLLSQRFIYASINSAKQAISPKDTGNFTYLKGKIKFQNGFAKLNPIKTSGPNMSMYITGLINLINNEADLQILGKISTDVSSSLGAFGSTTIKDLIDEHTKHGQTIANLFNFYHYELPEVDISKIPILTPDLKNETKNFRVIISGDTQSVKAVKSFTWVNPLGTKQKILTQQIDTTMKSTENTNTEQKQTQAEPQRTIKQPDIKKTETPDFLNNIPDTFN